MPRLAVRSVQGEERLQLSFKYTPAEGGQQRTFNLDRLKNEEVDKSLARISANISKTTKKKKKGKWEGKSAPEASEEPEENELFVKVADWFVFADSKFS